jgi:beta-glucosidase
MGRRELQEVFLPVFAKAVKAGAQGAMSSYNEIDGVPTSSDYWLMTQQLRGEFGFDGYVSSDFGAITGLGPDNHAVAASDEECVKMFIEAGGSVNGHDFGNNYEKLIVGLVQGGKMSEEVLDKATANVLRVKARLGVIVGGPNATNATLYTDESLIRTNLGANADHVAVGVRAARESVVLLKNEKSTLPLVGAKKVQCSACSAVQYSACSAVRSAVRCSAVQCVQRECLSLPSRSPTLIT